MWLFGGRRKTRRAVDTEDARSPGATGATSAAGATTATALDAASAAVDSAIASNGAGDAGGVTLAGGDPVRQKVSLHHVVYNVFYSAPVKVRPIRTKKTREHLIWIELDESRVDMQRDDAAGIEEADWEAHKNSFPSGVSVDAMGNIFVAARKDGSGQRKISGDDVIASLQAPPPPCAPVAVNVRAESFAMQWESVLGLPDVFEVRMSKAGGPWEALGSVSADCLVYEMETVECGVPYIFAVRAHNYFGFGEFSPPSAAVATTAEPPGAAVPPFVQEHVLRWDRLLLQWRTPALNGADLEFFRVVGGAIADEKVEVVHEAQVPYVALRNLRPRTAYHYRVMAANGVGEGPWSEYATFRTPARDHVRSGYVPDWAQLDDELFVNVETGAEASERPAALDGPVDPLVEFRKKRFHFNKELLRDVPKGPLEVVRLNLDKSRLLADSKEQIMARQSELLKKLKVEYVGESGIDSGGIAKDWFLELSRLLLGPATGLFVRNEGAVDLPADLSAVPPGLAHSAEEVAEWYHFAGVFLGKAILDRQLIDASLSRTLCKQLLGERIDIDDLRDSDPALVKNVTWMLDNDIDGVIFEEMCVTEDPPPWESEQKVVDLIPDGRNVELTNDNKEQYVELMLKWRAVDSCAAGLQAMRAGFHRIVPEDVLKAAKFDLAELDLLWNGLPSIDVLAIRTSCKYQGGFDTNHKVVHWFWDVWKNLEQDDKASVLQFVTGTSKMPVDGFSPPFNLTLNEDLDDEALPKAHTCFCQLVLPNYRTKDTLAAKLLFAAQNTSGFLLA